MGKRSRRLKPVKGKKVTSIVRDEAAIAFDAETVIAAIEEGLPPYSEPGPQWEHVDPCPSCAGRRWVRDRRGRLCICVACFLPTPISRSSGR